MLSIVQEIHFDLFKSGRRSQINNDFRGAVIVFVACPQVDRVIFCTGSAVSEFFAVRIRICSGSGRFGCIALLKRDVYKRQPPGRIPVSIDGA